MKGDEFLKEAARRNLLNNDNPKEKPPKTPREQLKEQMEEWNLRLAEDAQLRAYLADLDKMASHAEEDAARYKAAADEMKRRLGSPEQPKPATPQVTGTDLAVLVVTLLNQGVDPGIVAQVLQGQSANHALRQPISIGQVPNIPDWVGDIVRDALKAKDDIKTMALGNELKNLENKLGDAIKAMEGKRQARDEFSPEEYARRQVEGIKAFVETLTSLGLMPQGSPQIPADQTFAWQDRQWTHDERQTLLQIEAAKLESQERIELTKVKQRQDMVGSIPEAIGGVIAKGIADGMAERRQRQPAGGAPERPRGTPTIQVEPGEGDVVEVNCVQCGAPISVVASEPSATCAQCGLKYKVQRMEGKSGEV